MSKKTQVKTKDKAKSIKLEPVRSNRHGIICMDCGCQFQFNIDGCPSCGSQRLEPSRGWLQ